MHSTQPHSSLALLLGIALTGCPGPEATNDASLSPDTFAANDASSGGVDSGMTASDSGTPEPDAGAASADLVRCRTAAAAYAALCTDDGDRVCHVAALGAFCSETGQPALYAAALDCLRTNSVSNSCRTFSDPSGAGACVEAVYAGATNTLVTSTLTRLNALCTSAPLMPQRFEPPLWALSTEQLNSVQPCLTSATDCRGAEVCFATIQAQLLACYE